jgi:hypothetical protein
MGEIGANDYNVAFHFASKTIEEVNRMGLVSDNVKSIKKAIEVSQRTRKTSISISVTILLR